MSKETIDELRNRLLRDPEIQTMIRMRAYEIYQLRGGEPGHQAEDWFQAEMEMLQFLIEEESHRAAESNRREIKSAQAASAASATGSTANTSIEQPPQPTAAATESAESTASLGVWSATEPHSTALAPPIGNATEFQIESPKKPRSRASSKSSSWSKSAKKTTRNAASKKAADPTTKPKRTRKKSEEPSAEKQ